MLAYRGAVRTHRTNPTCCPLGSDQHRRRHCQAWTTRVTALPRHKSRFPIRGFLPAQVQQRSRTSGAPGLRNSRRSSKPGWKAYLATVFIIAPSSFPLTTALPPYRPTAFPPTARSDTSAPPAPHTSHRPPPASPSVSLRWHSASSGDASAPALRHGALPAPTRAG